MNKVRFILLCAVVLLASCAPVFREDIMKDASLNPFLSELNANAASYEGKLFVFAGMLDTTRVTKEGSLIEAVFIPVDRWGRPGDYMESVRFLALYPLEKGILDPLIFRKNRLITIAAIYKGVRIDRLGEIEYPFSYFEISDFRLWEDPYPAYNPSPYWWYDPWYDPWFPHRRWR